MAYFRFCEKYAKFLLRTLFVLGFSLLFAVTLQVAGRYVPFVPRYLWPLELTNFSLIWMIFIGSILGVREGRHFNVDIFSFVNVRLSPTFNFFLRLVYYFVLLVVTWIFIYYGYQYFINWGLIQSSDITGINLGWLYASVPISGVSWLIFLVESILKEFIKPETAKGGA